MQPVIYFLLALFATTVGSLTGMGGGVIIKPLMDVLGDYDAVTIGIVSSITVFSMAVVSLGKQLREKTEIPFSVAVPLGVGSVAGGFLGERLLRLIVRLLNANSVVTVVQNIVLAVLILCVFVYMKNKERVTGKKLNGIAPTFSAGVFLGSCSSFLGIGGGPINVALIIYLFSVTTKTATVCSIVTILFAQISKLLTVAVTSGLGGYDLSAATLMIAGAILGGFIGAGLNKKCSEKAVERAFGLVQLLVLGITVFNILRNLI